MSKEQTPIDEEITNILNSIDCFNNGVEPIKELIQAKVLEALEREVPKAYMVSELEYINLTMRDEFYKNLKINQRKKVAKEYYETEVKPRYNK